MNLQKPIGKPSRFSGGSQPPLQRNERLTAAESPPKPTALRLSVERQ